MRRVRPCGDAFDLADAERIQRVGLRHLVVVAVVFVWPPVPVTVDRPVARSAWISAHRVLFTAAASRNGRFAPARILASRFGSVTNTATSCALFRWLNVMQANVMQANEKFVARLEPPFDFG